MKWIPCLVSLFAFVSWGKAASMPVPVWSIEALTKASDVVAFVEPLKTRKTDDPPPPPHGTDLPYQSLESDFRPVAILKGSLSGETITLLHYRYADGRIAIINDSARFLQFSTGRRTYKATTAPEDGENGAINHYSETPHWLAFLKRLPDGRFVPVTGAYYTGLAFMEIHWPN